MIFAPLTEDLIPPLAQLWHDGWHDGHAGIVPDALTALRVLDNFADRLRAHWPHVTVAVQDGVPVGFFLLEEDELEQFYVAPSQRGTGLAQRVIREAERRLAQDHKRAWLACSVGNARAARFYEKSGWVRMRVETFEAETSAGPFPLDVWRYEKTLS